MLPFRRLVIAAVCLIGMTLAQAQAQAKAKAPDILLLMPDQMRGDCLSALGHPAVKTPNLDKLAARGVAVPARLLDGAVLHAGQARAADRPVSADQRHRWFRRTTDPGADAAAAAGRCRLRHRVGGTQHAPGARARTVRLRAGDPGLDVHRRRRIRPVAATAGTGLRRHPRRRRTHRTVVQRLAGGALAARTRSAPDGVGRAAGARRGDHVGGGRNRCSSWPRATRRIRR